MVRDSSQIKGDLSNTAYDAVRAAIDAGRLDMARMEEAYNRVQRLKTRLKSFQHRTVAVEHPDRRAELR